MHKLGAGWRFLLRLNTVLVNSTNHSHPEAWFRGEKTRNERDSMPSTLVPLNCTAAPWHHGTVAPTEPVKMQALTGREAWGKVTASAFLTSPGKAGAAGLQTTWSNQAPGSLLRL